MCVCVSCVYVCVCVVCRVCSVYMCVFVCVCVCVCCVVCVTFCIVHVMCLVTVHNQVTVPAELTALMSAERLREESHSTDASKKVCRFHQRTPIPSYLIALVVGALDSRQVFHMGWWISTG